MLLVLGRSVSLLDDSMNATLPANSREVMHNCIATSQRVEAVISVSIELYITGTVFEMIYYTLIFGCK